MTRNRLFSRDRYPIRKRAHFALAENRITIMMEIYFEKTDAVLHGQRIGEYTAVTSPDGHVLIATAKVIEEDGQTTYYIERSGRLQKILPENLALLTKAFENGFKTVHRIDLSDEEHDAAISRGMAQANWERF
ncbi:MAG: hypothetical protein A3I44_02015 [Candidatus Sungbacteria bacterium RIFCSPLOWO2_02_FULL_51_17]|uniref:Uncharacterized protein n=1 Tax=Candidatus Sungbacteria bacterium RIFCSPHIGHO2_02_FULL_51_29 TaxID=1802273 RepID=A0A1G2KV32_9BACT|nr:MAG: hypothetical protein A2676_04340 [Candidatus Sungbacteria bacterium RIFCSPHIGHO2_01_FULL_51_22]OHA03024.1 MAG: hypothetical protein A3C16_02775 [Candidatus Sungbacteria bacterium RIFCSPHIGHO2_02_FULL_51_29]OHA05616.1 MAG: hypothetical protein A3B29_02940 [Candidatus Sungbacteria bacterium RIFCSPLOWO2_01_FULL_51_34]OHA11057.1 MAG: hypothetical protein A3I44_02015 [Candidatus Sungbacteria bacterium RIFCSPLOWO2_02_FULL_51_17]